MRVVLLGSGRGSNAAAILQAEKEKRLGRAQVVAVYSDREEAPILSLAREYGKKGEYLSPGKFRTKLEGEGEDRYIAALEADRPDLIVLAGFMRVVKEKLLRAFAGKIINLHPSLLPSFKGLDGIGQALDYGVSFTGCTVHYVTAEVDGGRILDQAVVRILPGDDRESLGARVHAAEHQLLPQVIARLSRGGN